MASAASAVHAASAMISSAVDAASATASFAVNAASCTTHSVFRHGPPPRICPRPPRTRPRSCPPRTPPRPGCVVRRGRRLGHDLVRRGRSHGHVVVHRERSLGHVRRGRRLRRALVRRGGRPRPRPRPPWTPPRPPASSSTAEVGSLRPRPPRESRSRVRRTFPGCRASTDAQLSTASAAGAGPKRCPARAAWPILAGVNAVAPEARRSSAAAWERPRIMTGEGKTKEQLCGDG